jgi:hypothetical protein
LLPALLRHPLLPVFLPHPLLRVFLPHPLLRLDLPLLVLRSRQASLPDLPLRSLLSLPAFLPHPLLPAFLQLRSHNLSERWDTKPGALYGVRQIH